MTTRSKQAASVAIKPPLLCPLIANSGRFALLFRQHCRIDDVVFVDFAELCGPPMSALGH